MITLGKGFRLGSPGLRQSSPALAVEPFTADLGWATVSDVIGAGTDQTGVAYVVPTETSAVTLATAQRTADGLAIDGAQMNPARIDQASANTQAYDARITGSYDATKAATFPAAVSAGDVLVQAQSLVPVVGSDGYCEGYRVLHAIARQPSGQEMLPSAVGWAGRGTPSVLPFNAAARLAELETYDATGLVFPAYATLMAALEKYPLVLGQNTHTNSGAGYESLTPSGATGSPGVGYSFSVARVQTVALFALTADPSPYTPTERLALYRKIVRAGEDIAGPIINSPWPQFADGAHCQTAIAFGIEALRATGRSDQIAGFRAAFGGSLRQYFRIDQAYLDTQKVPHTDLAKSCMYRQRTLPDQSTASATQVIIPTVYGGSGGVLGDWSQVSIPPGSVVTRPSDGATAVVQAHAEFPSGSTGTLTLTIDAQPSPAFAQSDVIYVAWPPGVWELGDAAWGLRGLDRASYITPSVENDYTGLRTEGAQALWLDMQGTLPENMQDILDFAGWADLDDTPAANNDWTPQWGNGGLGTVDLGQHVWRRVLNRGSPDFAGYSETVVDEGGTLYRVHRFNVSGTLELPDSVASAEYLIAGGGGGGGGQYRSGGGGAGGVLTGTTSLAAGSFPVVIGAGGLGGIDAGTLATSGSDTTFAGLVATGGGAGGRLSGTAPSVGGSGGGGGPDVTGAAGTAGQGNAGGDGLSSPSFMGQGGGGGGSAAAGADATSGNGGTGGAGVLSTLTGSTAYYGGGGGGGVRAADGGTAGAGGLGGGGAGGFGDIIDEASTVGTDGVFGTGGGGGGGGGGGSGSFGQGGDGGSGTVIVRYEISA